MLITPANDATNAEMLRLLTAAAEEVKAGRVKGLAIIMAQGPGGMQINSCGQTGTLVIGAEKLKLDLIARMFAPLVMNDEARSD